MPTVVKLDKLETKMSFTSNEALDLIYWHRVEYMKMAKMTEKDRKNSYLSYSRCLNFPEEFHENK